MYSPIDYGLPRPVSLKDYTPDFWQSMSLSFREAWEFNPSPTYARTNEIRGGSFFEHAYSSSLADADVVNNLEEFLPPEPLALEKQQAMIDEAGLSGEMTPHGDYSEQALTTIIRSKKYDRAIATLKASAPGWHTPFSFAAAFAAGLLDPANLVCAFIPTVGEERMLSLLGASMGTAGGRAATRAGMGAASGATFAAMYEPMIMTGQMELQNDYSFYNSLMNMTLGTLVGAAIPPAAGMVGDMVRAKRGVVQPWAYASPTRESEQLLGNYARIIEDTRMAARPGQAREQVAANARADAARWDMYLRHLAFMEKTPLEELYRRHEAQFRNGEQFVQAAARLEKELADLRTEMDGLPELRRQAEELGLRDATQPLQEYELAARARDVESALVETRRQGEADLAEMLGGETFYSRETQAAPTGKAVPAPGEPAGNIGLGNSRDSRSVAPDGEDHIIQRAEIGEALISPYLGNAPLPGKGESAISGITPPVLAGEVNPGRIHNNILFQRDGATGLIRGAATFIPDSPAIIRIFQAHDETTVANELGHVARRVFEEHARAEGGNPQLRREYERFERQYGVEPGGEWTTGQEEAFARDFGGHLFGFEKAPQGLENAYAVMRDNTLEMYQSADSAGVPMSYAARNAFNNLVATPLHESRKQFTEAMGRYWTEPADRMLNARKPNLDSPVMEHGAERLTQLRDEARAVNDWYVRQLEQTDPENAGRLRAELEQRREAFEIERARIEEEKGLFEELAICFLEAGS